MKGGLHNDLSLNGMEQLRQENIWSLEVNFYPSAAKAGVHPVDNFVAGLANRDDPQYYRSHKFLFANTPTLEDFLLLCKRLAWTSVWDESLLKLVNKKMWGELPIGRKVYTIYVMEDDLKVGHIEIRREWIYVN